MIMENIVLISLCSGIPLPKYLCDGDLTYKQMGAFDQYFFYFYVYIFLASDV